MLSGILASLLFAAFWGMWSFFAQVPSSGSLVLDRHTNLFLTIPFSRWLDIPLAFLLVNIFGGLLRLIAARSGQLPIVAGEFVFFISFGVALGLIFGLVSPGLIPGLVFGLLFTLILGLMLSLIAGLGVGRATGLGFSLGFSLGLGIGASLIAGLGASLGIVVAAGLVTGLGASLASAISAITRQVFSSAVWDSLRRWISATDLD